MTDTLPVVPQASGMAAINSTVLMNPDAYKQMMAVAEFMAKGVATIPKHLQGKPADCLAIVMQSMVWGMLPHVVAQKTYTTPAGIIGYEGQLVHAVAVGSGVFDGSPKFEHFGDWSKIRGKTEWVKKGEGDSGSEKGYHKAIYTKNDEQGLGVSVIAKLRGEDEPRVLQVFMTQCQPRFSTNWAIDPEQQICYVAMRRFVRRFCPGVLMGIYTNDELDDMPPEQVDENTRRGREQPRKSDIKAEYPAERFTENLPKWRKSIEGGRQTADAVIAMISGEYTLSDAQKNEISFIKPIQPKEVAATGDVQ